MIFIIAVFQLHPRTIRERNQNSWAINITKNTRLKVRLRLQPTLYNYNKEIMRNRGYGKGSSFTSKCSRGNKTIFCANKEDALPLKITKGVLIGMYTLVQPLGRGGNGVVWRVNTASCQYAMKFLNKINDPKAYKRFRTEIKTVVSLGNQPGILPIVDFHLPQKGTPWYTMPIATPIADYIVDSHDKIPTIIKGIVEIAQVLQVLHSNHIHHRDIKPSNMYKYQDRWVLSDFGLVEFPNKEGVTSQFEQVGPRWTIAPEMQRDPLHADGASADIYSLAKTLWILLTGIKPGFEGKYNRLDPVTGIRFHLKDEFWLTIDDLLERSTDNLPQNRPTAKEFTDVLIDWIANHNNFMFTNAAEWKFLLDRVFPHSIPDRAEWSNLDSMIALLNLLGTTRSLNHLFLPSGGGLDLLGAKRSVERDCLELNLQGMAYVLKPSRLQFEGFGANASWNYFRIETNPLEQSGVYEKLDRIDEEVTEISPGNYVHHAASDEGEYEGRPLPRTARVVSRYFNGSFVIFAKTSVYNQVSETYDGRHNKMDSDKFRAYIKRSVEYAARSDS